MKLDFITKDLLGSFSKISSVVMPTSLPLHLCKITPKSLFVLKSFKSKPTLKNKANINILYYYVYLQRNFYGRECE